MWIKNRRPDLWRDKIGYEHTEKDGALLGCIICGSHLTGAISGEDVEESALPDSHYSDRIVTEF